MTARHPGIASSTYFAPPRHHARSRPRSLPHQQHQQHQHQQQQQSHIYTRIPTHAMNESELPFVSLASPSTTMTTTLQSDISGAHLQIPPPTTMTELQVTDLQMTNLQMTEMSAPTSSMNHGENHRSLQNGFHAPAPATEESATVD